MNPAMLLLTSFLSSAPFVMPAAAPLKRKRRLSRESWLRRRLSGAKGLRP